MTQVYKVQLSMNQRHLVDSGLTFKQGDFGFQIEIEVLDFDVTGVTPQIIFRKSTGAVESTSVTASGNKFTYTMRGTELDTPGPAVCDLKLKNSTTQRISTASFRYFVEADTMDGLNQQANSYSDTIEQILSGVDAKIYASADLADESFTICNNLNPTISYKQGNYGDHCIYDSSITNQITSDLLKIPTGTQIAVTTIDSSYQTVIREYTPDGSSYTRTQNIVVAGDATLNSTKAECYYCIGLYKYEGVTPDKGSILTVALNAPIKTLYSDFNDVKNNYPHVITDSITDANNMTANGIYSVDYTYANVPSDMNNNGVLVTHNYSSGRMLQIIAQNAGSGAGTKFWIRSKMGTSFTSWEKLVTSNNEIAEYKGQITSGSSFDANEVVSFGIYAPGSSQNAQHVPESIGTLIDYSKYNRGGQFFLGYDNGDIWYRSLKSGTFSEWKSLTQNESNSIAYSSENNYLINFGKYNMLLFRTIDANADQDNWNIGDIRYNNNVVVPSGTDIIGPLKVTGENDFMSGVHGSSTTTDIKVWCDGQEQTLNSSLSKQFNKMVIMMKDECRLPSNLSHVFDRYVTIEVTKNKIRITNTFENVSGSSISVARATNGGLIAVYNDTMLSSSMPNKMLLAAPTTEISNQSQKNIHAIINTLYGSICVDNILGHEQETYRGYYNVFLNETRVRTKTYFDIIANGKNVANGEQIMGEFEYTFS